MQYDVQYYEYLIAILCGKIFNCNIMNNLISFCKNFAFAGLTDKKPLLTRYYNVILETFTNYI